MVKAVFDNLKSKESKKFNVVGITDDVTFTSIPVGPDFDPTPGSKKS